MRIDVFIRDAAILLASIDAKAEAIMATQAEQAAKLRAIFDQLGKVKTEIVTAVEKLTAAVEAGGDTTPEVDAATQALQEAVQGLDDLNPDEPAPTP
jgi:ribosomal protein S20